MIKFTIENFFGKFFITAYSVIVLIVLCLFSSCQSEEEIENFKTRSTILELNITMPLSSEAGYEDGSKEENTISDYKIYIYDTDNKYIMGIDNSSIFYAGTEENTSYTITAQLSDENGNNPLEDYSDGFKIVMLANWGTYTEPTEGSTIDELCETGTFSASTFYENDITGKIPYYGVHEYTGISFQTSGTTYLSGNLTLLRALAKVEVILTNDDIEISAVNIVHYNLQGYCAPTNVYSQDDYGQGTSWDTDYLSTLHLVGGDNNKDDGWENRSNSFKEDTSTRTWTIYLPEYDNSSTDYSYISLTKDGEEYKIYFAEYENGVTDAYDGGSLSRWNIYRNNLYRYYVEFSSNNLIVVVQDWIPLTGDELTF